VFTPRPASSFTAASDAARGFRALVGPSSVEGFPSTLSAIAVPDVITNGLSVPASTSPIATIAAWSSAQFCRKREKSWLNPQ
jgi:hypothetical protein